MDGREQQEPLSAPLQGPSTPLELWGGAEYTCNRVHGRYLDQMEFSGHAHRAHDLQSFRELGIRTLRVGLLWERHELDPSWRWTDERLAAMQSLGIRPIAGLVHHGSGPRHTSLIDPEFPRKLAAYAGAVAERYPHIDAYTPVNEPHTTARFSALYGLWYPHHTSRSSFLRALLVQLKATVLSMQAIRRVRPDAQLVQTDDVGTVTGTESLRPVWQTLDLRRWLPFDLLCGRVDAQHPLFEYIHRAGIPASDILWFVDHPCPPDVLGVNYYVTSDRYLDDRLDLYPEDRRSAEGAFVDVEAVRVAPQGLTGISSLLLEAWQRYKMPLAVTEVHLGACAEEQIRWLTEMWHGVQLARAQGAECRALTVWALLGSFYWNQLVTHENGHYEPGAFSVRHGRPVPTPLASLIRQLAAGAAPQHAALEHAGWWQNESRICFPCTREEAA